MIDRLRRLFTWFILFQIATLPLAGGLGWTNRPANCSNWKPQSLVPTDHVWLGADERPLPFQSVEEILDFLKTAKVVSTTHIGIGVNGVDKLLLEKEGVRLYAAFRDVRIKKHLQHMAQGQFEINFRDDCIFELAAFRLARALGLNNVPPVVERKLGRRKGTLQIWVEKTMMEKERLAQSIEPPSKASWLYQTQTMYLFDLLIANDDRNQGNVLIDGNWKMWLIDHTRSFRRNKEVSNMGRVHYCRKGLYEKLTALKDSEIKEHLKNVLTASEVKALLERRRQLVRHIETLIEKKGESGVLFP